MGNNRKGIKKMEQAVSISKEVSKKRGIPGSTLKIIAITTMFIDHVGAVVLEGKLSDLGMAQAMQTQAGLQEFMAQYGVLYLMDMIMRLIGRMGFPIFCFLLIEGFLHTRSRLKYGRNLLLFALISEVPFDLAITRGMGDVPMIGGVLYPYYQNVFFTLFIGLLCMCGYELVSRHAEAFGKNIGTKVLAWMFRITGIVLPAVVIRSMILNYIGELPDTICWSVGILVPVLLYAAVFISKNSVASWQVLCADMTILALGMIVADLLHTDYSALGILTITLMYAFRKNHVKSVLSGCIALTVFNFIEITSFFTLIPVKKYNGERGLSLKYFFYAFYPVHLFLLYLISRYLI